MIDQPTIVVSKTDVLDTWKKFGFTPTTDEDRAKMQAKNPHQEQCKCRFCQAKEGRV